MLFRNAVSHVRFRATELDTETGEVVKIINRLPSGFYCFGPYLDHVPDDTVFKTNYEIYVFNEGYGRSMNFRHDVYLTEEELKIYLNWVETTYNPLYPISIIKAEHNEGIKGSFPGYEIKLTVEGNKVRHLWLLNMIRMVYEYPFNLCLKEAFRVKYNSYLPEELKTDSFINLIQVILSTWHINSIAIRSTGIYYYDQSPFEAGCHLIDTKTINTRLDEKSRVLDIYVPCAKWLDMYERICEGNDALLYDYNYSISLFSPDFRGNSYKIDILNTIFNSEFWLNTGNTVFKDNAYEHMYNILKKE